MSKKNNFMMVITMPLNNTERIIASALLMFLAVVFGVVGDITMTVLLLTASVSLMFLPNIKSLASYIRYRLLSFFTSSSKTIHVKRQRQSIFGMIHGYLMKYDFFSSMSKNMRQTTISGAISSGSLASPFDTSKNIILVFVMSLIAATITSVVGVLLLAEPLFLASLLLPLFVRLYPYLSNVLMTSDMVSFYDSELAYFLAYLQISTIAGFGLYDSMKRLLGKNIIESVERDAATLKKWIYLDGHAEHVAIHKLAESHSHKTFQTFLYSYSDIAKSNPSGLENFVTQTADSEFEKITNKNEKKIGKVSSVFVYGAMAMIMAPVMMLTMMFMQSDSQTIQLITYAIFLIPVAFAMFVFFSNHTSSDVTLSFNKRSVLGVFAGVPWYVITGDALASVALSACVISVYNGINIQRQISAWRSKTDGFPVFVRDLIERYKVDSNFVVSTKKILQSQNNEKKYGMFCDVLSDVNSRLYQVTDKSQDLFYDYTLQSKRIRLLMFILQTAFDGGYFSSLSSLERIHSFSINLNSIQNRIDDSLRMSSMILFAAPVVFFVTMIGLSAMLMSFTDSIPDMSNTASTATTYLNPKTMNFFVKPDYSELLLALKPAVLIMSACAGLVISRVAYSSFVATLPVGICLGMAFVILSGWDVFFEVFDGMLS